MVSSVRGAAAAGNLDAVDWLMQDSRDWIRGACRLRISSRANRMPPSYSRYMGIAMMVCEMASGGVSMAAIMNTAIST